MAIDVLGAVIENVTGQSLPNAVADLVLRPLEMEDTGFAVVDPGRLVVHYADGKPEPRRMTDDDRVNFYDTPVAFSPVRLLEQKAFPSGGAGMAGTGCAARAVTSATRACHADRPAVSGTGCSGP